MDARHLDLIERIKNAQFRTTRLSPGYDEEEVDNFLDRVVAILRESALPTRKSARRSVHDEAAPHGLCHAGRRRPPAGDRGGRRRALTGCGKTDTAVRSDCREACADRTGADGDPRRG
jgi:DivIVA domain-containing protein